MRKPPSLAPFRGFVRELAILLDRQLNEPEIVSLGGELLARLVAHDDWLPDAYAQPHPLRYQQYLLHADALVH